MAVPHRRHAPPIHAPAMPTEAPDHAHVQLSTLAPSPTWPLAALCLWPPLTCGRWCCGLMILCARVLCCSQLEDMKMGLVMEAERHRIEISARQAKADDIKKALATANEEAAHAQVSTRPPAAALRARSHTPLVPSPQRDVAPATRCPHRAPCRANVHYYVWRCSLSRAACQAERTRLEMDQKAAASDGKREQDGLNRRSKEYANELKRCKRTEVQLQTAQAQVPFMRRQLEEANRDLQSLQDEGRKQRGAVEELKREVDIFINSFLRQEGVEREKQDFLRSLLDQIKTLEEELVEESRYEQQQRKEVARLTGERETNAREAAKAVAAARETHEELKVKELVIIDLSKKHVETGARLREFSKL
jgi:DNA repair exonuclease SbcCD ATPase subunit